MWHRKLIKAAVHALARLIQPAAPVTQASVMVGDIITCGSIVGRVKELVANDGGTIDAVILIRDRDGQLATTILPADGRYDIELEVIEPADAVSRGLLFSRWRAAIA